MVNLKDSILINITDYDGFQIEGKTYRLANGQPIIMFSKNYPVISYDNYLNVQENLHTLTTLNNDLAYGLGPIKFSGNVRPTITFTVIIPIVQPLSRAEYEAVTNPVPLTYYLLYNMWRYPHKMYLKDSLDSTKLQGYDYPINHMLISKDQLGQDIISEKGLPVVLKSIRPAGEGYIKHSEVRKQAGYLEYELEFIMDG